MGWFEQLKSLFETKLRLTINANRTVNNNLIIVQQKKESVSHGSGIVPLEIEGLAPEQKRLLQKVLREAVEEGGVPLLEISAEKTIEEVKQLDQSDEQRRIIDKLREIIPPGDVPILRVALFLRKKFQDGDPAVQELKQQLMQRYGDRGRRIANLASADYFQEAIIPLLDAMGYGKPEFKRAAFQKSYEIFIQESGFALFVHSGMSETTIRKTIFAKIKSNLKYGIKHLHIHGIGKSNLQNIRRAVAAIIEEYESIEKSTEELTGQVILIRLEFGPELDKQIPQNGDSVKG